MITIIAEKPSVALEIARIVGARRREDGFMSGGGYAVTWALGHLVEIWAEGGDDWGAPLPFLPEAFRLRVATSKGSDGRLRPDPGYKKQLDVIRRLFSRSEYIVNAGDAGREGELIQRYIYSFVGATAPVRRLWISSLTDEAIREGLRSLRDSSEFDCLYLAGKARSEADWLVGVNATRALTRAGGGELKSLGRVQTPTLALVCRRFLENRDFRPETFNRLTLEVRFGSDRFTVRGSERFPDGDPGLREAMLAVKADGCLRVDSVEKKSLSQAPPLLHDLTSLQREANRRYGLSAAETLSAAQSLYEGRLITYPRTGSRFITEDVYRTLPGLLGRLVTVRPDLPVGKAAEGKLSRRSVSDAKVTDHHALLPTGNAPGGSLTEREKRVYELVLIRLLEAVGQPCELLSTTVSLSVAGYHFPMKGSTVLEKGWRSVRGEDPDAGKKSDEDGPTEVPALQMTFQEGDVCTIEKVGFMTGTTMPRPLYTEDSLLEAMEHAGREVGEEDLKDALKGCGLGTPATRAGEIETIIRRGYVLREGKSLVPTRLGLSVYDAVKDKTIADVALTARWEKTLSEIAEGKADVRQFDKDIRRLTAEIVSEIGGSGDIASGLAEAETLPGASCPLCGRAVMLTTRLARCVDDNCGWKIWRTLAGRTLSEKELSDLLGEGRVTAELKGFRSKTGKSFSALVRLGSDGTPSLEFPDRTKDPEGNTLRCPLCHEPVVVRPKAVSCTDEGCGWILWRQVAGKQLSDEAVLRLLRGQATGVLKGFKGKGGKSFDASLSLNAEGKVDFSFPRKINLSKKSSKW